MNLTMGKNQAEKIMNKIKSSKALIFETRLKTLTINFSVFDGNYKSLKKLMEMMKDPDVYMRVWDLDNPTNVELVQYDVVRRLLNYLSSAMSLKEHTRILINSLYQKTEFEAEYKIEIISIFKEKKVVGFIEELRNYSLHYSLPISIPKFSIQMDQDAETKVIEHYFYLDKKKLLEWSSWKAKAKPYLEEQIDEIDVETLIDEYYEIVSSFHNWLYEKIYSIHKNEIDWISKMRNKLRQLGDL